MVAAFVRMGPSIDMTRRLLVAIPAYNCRDQIGRVLAQFDEATAARYAEIVVIDNRSRDGTLEAARAAAEAVRGAPVTLMRNRENYNLGGTHKVAFARCLESGCDGVVILHGDDQGAIADFADLDQEIARGDPACVLGARFQKGSRIAGYSAFRRFGNHVFNGLYSACVGARVHDMGSGLNYYSRRLIEATLHPRMPDDLTFNNCILLATYAAGHEVRFKPISWREDDQTSNARLLRQARKLLHYLTLYVVDRTGVLTRDFREVARDAYPSDVVFTTAQARS